MKHFTKLLFITLLSVLLGNATAWGDEVTLDYDCTNGNTPANNGISISTSNYTVTKTISGSSYVLKITNANQDAYTKISHAKNQDAVQFGTGSNPLGSNFSITLQTQLTNISSVEIQAYANGGGTLSIGVGNNDGTITKAFKYNNGENTSTTMVSGTSPNTYIFNGDATTGYLIIGKSATKYFRIKSIKITYNTSSPSLTSSDLTLTGSTALSFDLYNNSSAQTVSYTTSSSGAVTVSGGTGYVTTSVDETNKTITVTPTAVTPSAQTITVSQAADATYNAGSATFTVTITDSTPITPSTEEWVETSITDLTSSDVFVIVGNNGSNYAMTNNNGTSNPPAATGVTVEGNKITSTVADNLKWNISGNATEGYTFYPNGSTTTWLYCTNTNNGVRVGVNDGKTFKLQDNYLHHNTTSRFVGIYNSQDWRCYTSSGGNIANQTFKFYKKVTDSNLPNLSAEDVNIEYNAESGSIAYTLTNPVDGGTLTATSSEDWVTIGSVGESSIPFTTSANNTATPRTATVTLTYTYNTDETVTKSVTITQAANPNVVMTIAEVRAQETGDVKTQGIVTSCEGKTAYIQDNTAAVCVYNSSSNLELSVGDEITVEGSLTTFNGLLEIAPLTISTVSTGNAVTPTVKTIAEINTDANGDNDLQGMYVKIVDATVTAISVSGNSQSVTISQNGQTMTVYGGSLSVSANDVITVVGNIGCYNNVQIVHPQLVTFEITAESSNTEYGTVAVSGNTITATPVSGYRVSTTTAYEVTNGTATVTQDGNIFTVTATSDCTIRINFETIPTHTVTFSDNGNTSTETYAEDATITFPTIEDIAEFKFVGWTTTEINGTQETAPEMVTSATMSTTDITYYAVYAEESEGSGTPVTKWMRIGDASNIDGEGVYALLTHENTEGDNAAYAFNGEITSGHGQSTASYFTFDTEGYADTAPEGTCELTFTSVTVDDVSGYTMYNSNYGYLYASAASSGKLAWHETEESCWRHETLNEQEEWIYKANNAHLRVYSNTFRTYGANNNQSLYFAKKVTEQGTSLTNYRTKVAVTITFQKQNTSMYYSAYNLTVPEGVIAKTYKVANGKPVISKTYQAGETIAKATAVILTLTDQPSNAANLGLTKEFRLARTGVADEENKLVGWDEATLVSSEYPAEEYIAYVLSTKNGDNPGFYYMSGHPQGDTNFQSGAHKAVFPVLKSEASSSKSAWLFSEIDDEVTGISDASIMNHEENMMNNGVYDLQGRKVADNLSSILSHPSSQKGIYIVNGKKVIIK